MDKKDQIPSMSLDDRVALLQEAVASVAPALTFLERGDGSRDPRTEADMTELLRVGAFKAGFPQRPAADDDPTSDDTFWCGRAYVFHTLESAAERDPQFAHGFAEYGWRGFDPDRCQPRQQTWCLRDHPNLALQMSELATTGPDELVPRDTMLTFLETYGPLTWSKLVDSGGRVEDTLLASRQLVAAVGRDGRHGKWAFQFSRPVALIRAVTAAVSADGQAGIHTCLRALDLAPPGTLLRGLLRQLLDLALADQRPRPCAGCGKLFVTTENESQAHHRKGWKRKDAKYHSDRCRHAARERVRQAHRRAERLVRARRPDPDTH